MANQEDLDILKQGVEVWNQWRRKEDSGKWKGVSGIVWSGIALPKWSTLFIADLTDADLSGRNLSMANLNAVNLGGASLEGADLREANLSQAYLGGANLAEAKLMGADLSGAFLQGAYLGYEEAMSGDEVAKAANLSGANLSGATLIEANLYRTNLSGATLKSAKCWGSNFRSANLSGADLTGADLRMANLDRANLSGANLTNAEVGWTIFESIDLNMVKGLESVKHVGPSTIGIRSILRSKGNIPEVFLKGVGVDDTFITYIRSLVGKAIEYYSCFISYSSKDEAFAKRLYADLQSNNVRCWFATEDMKIGDRIRDRIDQSIRVYDKLLLILSEQSVMSEWVEDEVEAAMERERLAREQGEERTVLFPVHLDEAVKTTTKAWAAKLRRQRHIGDFTHWKNHDDYQKAFARLLRDLKAEA